MTKPKAFVSRSPIGIFAFSEDGKLLHYKLFDKKPEKAANKINEDVKDFIEGYDIIENEKARKFTRKHVREYAISLGFASSDKELNEFLSRFGILLSKKRVNISRDKFIVHSCNALININNTINLFAERLHEWYLLHYPETRLSQKELIENIIKYGSRERFPDFKESSGIELTSEDEKILKSHAEMLKILQEKKTETEKYVKDLVKETAPSFSSLIDPILAARMIALAGSLERLSKMTASTIQLLGAEKALFRHLKKKGKSPKYGIIYNDVHIQSAPEKAKGKVARILASKLMLAARIDFYSKRFEPRLKEDLEKELKAIV